MRDGSTALTANIVLREMLARSQCSSPLSGQHANPPLVEDVQPADWQPTTTTHRANASTTERGDVLMGDGPGDAAAAAHGRGNPRDEDDTGHPDWQAHLLPRGPFDIA